MDVGDVPGLPPWVSTLFESRGVEDLYPPQIAAVEGGVTTGRNVVAAVPTASGKTLIAELAILSTISRNANLAVGNHGTKELTEESPDKGGNTKGDHPSANGGIALYIVPLRALASEKETTFADYEEYGLNVAVSTGNYESTEGWLADQDVVIATSEKVDSLVRNDSPWIDDVDCVIADEIHLVDDADRGPTLEVTLAKLRRLNPNVQTVALSATIGNATTIADWLDAELIDSDWRPIDLHRGVHYGQALHLADGTQREVHVRQGQKQTAALVADTVEEGGSSLVFVNSRKNAEAAATRLRDAVEGYLTDEELSDLEMLAADIREISDTETSDDLAAAVKRGAAFHHAGLARDHRTLIEDAFRDRLIKAVAATPTLAAGVNTPARRVVVRDWQRYDGQSGGMQPLSTLEVHQMMGRAGRPGRDPYGEAVLVAGSHDELDELFERYVWAEPEPVRSKLAAEPALRTHVLSTVASGFARTREELLAFLEETLYGKQTADSAHLQSVIDSVCEYLRRNGFLTDDEGEMTATSIGHTVSRLYLDPMSAATIVDGIRTAAKSSSGISTDSDDLLAGAKDDSNSENGVVPSGFETARELRNGSSPNQGSFEDSPVDPTALGLYHLIARTPDMYELYLRSGDRETYGDIANQRADELLGEPPTHYEDGRWEDWLSALKTARMLEDWANEVDEDRITERYGIGPGDVRAKVDTAEWLLGAAESIVAELDIDAGRAVSRARRRVAHGVREELLELTGVRGIGRKRARRLYDAGIKNRASLRSGDKARILGALRGRTATAEGILESVGRPDASMDDVRPARDVLESIETRFDNESTPTTSEASRSEEENAEDAKLGSSREGESRTENDQSNLQDF